MKPDSPDLGRFLSVDPAHDGTNWYAFAGNDPVNMSDPTGLSQAGHPLGRSTLAGPSIGGASLLAGLGATNARPRSSIDVIASTLGSRPAAPATRGITLAASRAVVQALNGPSPGVVRELQGLQRTQAYYEDQARWNAAQTVLAKATVGWKPEVSYTIGPVDRAFAAAGNASRAVGNALANNVEYVTSGYGGGLGKGAAAAGGFAAQLLRTAGHIGASIIDVPRTYEGALEDVRQTVKTGQQYGFRTALARQTGLLQGAEAYYGIDVLTGQAVDPWSKISEASGRLGATAGAGAGAGRLLSPTLEILETPAQIVSRVAQQQADNGLPHLGRFLSRDAQREYIANPAAGRRFLGTAVHKATDVALEDQYPGRFSYNAVGPDFLDSLTNHYIELTTPGQVGAHVAKRGAYTNAAYATYVLPKVP